MTHRAWVLAAALGIISGCGGEEESAVLPAPSGTVVEPPAPVVPEWPSIPGAWVQQASGISEDLTAVAALDANRAWIATAIGHVYRTQDGGATWDWVGIFPWARSSPFPPPNTSPFKASRLLFVDELHGWAVGPHGVVSTSNGGWTWTLRQEYWRNYFRDLSFINPTTGWVTAAGFYGHGGINQTADGGETWTPTQIEGSEFVSGHSVKFVDSQTGWLLAKGKLYRTVDQGQTWEAHAPLDPWGFYMDLSAVDDTHAWVLTKGYVFGTQAGNSWRVRHIDGSKRLQFVDASRGWVVGGKIHHTSDGGASWVEQSTPHAGFNGVAFVNASVGWVVGDGGVS